MVRACIPLAHNITTDINECEMAQNEGDACEDRQVPNAVCVNTVGSFNCVCEDGYQGQLNMSLLEGFTCVGEITNSGGILYWSWLSSC